MNRDSKRANALLTAVDRGYKISRQGTVTNPNGKILSGSLSVNYKEFSFRIDTKTVKVKYHQFQAYAKFGNELFNNQCVRHLNDNQEDNSWDNIALGSYSDNNKDIIINGHCNPTKAVEANRKLTDEQCVDVYNSLKQGVTQKFLCLKYGLGKSTLSCIINGSEYYINANK